MGETPFSLTYGAEAVIPTEVNLRSARVSGFSPAKNSDLMLKQLNLLEECWESTTIRLVKYQQKLAQRYNRDMRKREFEAGDLVLRKVVGNSWDVNIGCGAGRALGTKQPIVIVCLVTISSLRLGLVPEELTDSTFIGSAT